MEKQLSHELNNLFNTSNKALKISLLYFFQAISDIKISHVSFVAAVILGGIHIKVASSSLSKSILGYTDKRYQKKMQNGNLSENKKFCLMSN